MKVGRPPDTTSLLGQRFGRLLVVAHAGKRTTNGTAFWVCRCDCGKEPLVLKSGLKNGTTKSCGCLMSEMVAARNMTHGGTNSPEYSSWRAMLDRCLNKAATGYERYGGAGITVCEEWMDFSAFRSDMGARPAGTSLDRKDNAKGYFKENCRWATPTVQNNNTRRSALVEAFGRTRTVAEWAAEFGLDYSLLHGRLRRGINAERALTEKVRARIQAQSPNVAQIRKAQK